MAWDFELFFLLFFPKDRQRPMFNSNSLVNPVYPSFVLVRPPEVALFSGTSQGLRDFEANYQRQWSLSGSVRHLFNIIFSLGHTSFASTFVTHCILNVLSMLMALAKDDIELGYACHTIVL